MWVNISDSLAVAVVRNVLFFFSLLDISCRESAWFFLVTDYFTWRTCSAV